MYNLETTKMNRHYAYCSYVEYERIHLTILGWLPEGDFFSMYDMGGNSNLLGRDAEGVPKPYD